MAKRDVILRFAQIEHEYVEMCSLLDELQGDLKRGIIDTDYYNSRVEIIDADVEAIKAQYMLWGEVMFELNKPNRRSKRLNDAEQTWYNTLQTCTRECLKDESKDALANLKKIIAEGKLNDKQKN